MEIVDEIMRLKEERKAVILAHNYTNGEIQDIADFVGDSLELSRKAAACTAEVIVFCGVRFMAETAKILSPDATVLLPVPDAGCPMADMASTDEIKACRAANPDAVFVAYVNTTAETKTLVDICCTSGNAEKIISSIPEDKNIVFLPDGNLGANLMRRLGRKMTLWQGCCPIHNAISQERIKEAKAKHPNAIAMIHPECSPDAVGECNVALSTGGMLEYVKKSDAKEFIVVTEVGILHRLKKDNPDKVFYPLEPNPVCVDMKKLTLESIRDALKNLSPRIELSASALSDARRPIERMLSV